MYRLKYGHMEEIEIKKSRFICYVERCESEEEAKYILAKIKKMHPSARHACYAFVIGQQNEIQRSNDDGEPAGTAGVPMLECLTNRKMEDTIAVTIRYFGGIKLGAGGLIRAYSKSVSNALDHATLTKKENMKRYEFSFSYDLIGKIDYFFRSHDIPIISCDYNELVTYAYIVKESIDDQLLEITNGAYIPKFMNECIVDVDIKN